MSKRDPLRYGPEYVVLAVIMGLLLVRLWTQVFP